MAWTNQQKGILQAYRRYAGIEVAVYHNMLRNCTGRESSTHPALKQRDFDFFMPLMETYAHVAFLNGCGVGKVPCRGGNWYYWRNRCPRSGRADTRQLWHIRRLWDLLLPHLPAAQQTHDYECGIASRAAGRKIAHLHDLRANEASWMIEALKARLSQSFGEANLRREDAAAAVLHIVSEEAPNAVAVGHY